MLDNTICVLNALSEFKKNKQFLGWKHSRFNIQLLSSRNSSAKLRLFIAYYVTIVGPLFRPLLLQTFSPAGTG